VPSHRLRSPKLIETFMGAMVITIVTMLAAVISAFYPMFVFLPALSYPTLLCTFLVSIGVYLTVLGSYKNRKSLTIPGGLFWALAALTVAPTLRLIIPVMHRMMFVSPLKTKYKMIHAALLFLIFFDYFSTVDDQAVHLLPGCHAD